MPALDAASLGSQPQRVARCSVWGVDWSWTSRETVPPMISMSGTDCLLLERCIVLFFFFPPMEPLIG